MQPKSLNLLSCCKDEKVVRTSEYDVLLQIGFDPSDVQDADTEELVINCMNIETFLSSLEVRPRQEKSLEQNQTLDNTTKSVMLS